MRKYLYNLIIVLQLIIIGCFIKTAYSQSESGYLPSDPAYIASLPIMELTPESAALDLPSEVDNSTTMFFPRRDVSGDLYIYQQSGTSSCQSVSSIFNTFTYEINRLRNVASNTQQTRYAPNYSWNHLNDGICGFGGGTSLAAVHGFLKQAGAMSDWDFDGPAQLNKDDCLRWPTGYDIYYNTMQNKLESCTTLYFAPDGTGIEELKHYLYDHNTSITPPSGGVITFGARDYNTIGQWSGTSNIENLVFPSDHEGDQVRIKMEYWSNHGHSVAIIGYSDDVMYDWGGSGTQGNVLPDGEYRNDWDNDKDGDIDMSDWEIGAVKIVNSYDIIWGSDGFEWVLYCCLPNIVSPNYTGPINEFYALTPKETYDHGVVLKVKIDHEKREDIRLGCGYALTADATTYVTSYDLGVSV